jgi:hypothetical protein
MARRKRVIGLGRVVLVPAGDQAPAGRRVGGTGGRLGLGGGDVPEDCCWVAADDAELIETEACGTYLRVRRPARVERAGEAAVDVEPGLYQVIRKPA